MLHLIWVELTDSQATGLRNSLILQLELRESGERENDGVGVGALGVNYCLKNKCDRVR